MIYQHQRTVSKRALKKVNDQPVSFTYHTFSSSPCSSFPFISVKGCHRCIFSQSETLNFQNILGEHALRPPRRLKNFLAMLCQPKWLDYQRINIVIQRGDIIELMK